MATKRVRLWPALVLSGCVQALGIESDPQLVDGGAVDPLLEELPESDRAQEPWSCLDDGTATTLSVPPRMATVRVHACDFLNSCITPVPELVARVCGRRDINCTNPILEDIRGDENGDLEFTLPTGSNGFDGYLELNSPTHDCRDSNVFGDAVQQLCQLLAPNCERNSNPSECLVPHYARSLLFFNPPVVADSVEPIQLPLLSSVGLPQVVDAAGVALDPDAGNLFLTALDCNGTPAAGVAFNLKDNQGAATQLYIDSGAVSDSVLETDESGVGGFVGVPAGFAEVVAYTSDLQVIGEIGVLAAPYTMTYAALVPSP